MDTKRSAMLFLTVVLAAGNALAGYHFVAENRVETAGKEPQTYTVEGWVEGDKARMVFKGSSMQAGVPEGSYVISTDGGKTLYLVNPEEKTYSRWDMEAMLQGVGTMMNAMGGMMKMEIQDQKVDAAEPVSGGKILGYPTTKYVFDSSYTMVIKVFAMKQEQHVVSHEEIWATTDLADPGFAAWLRKRAPKTGNEDLDALIEAGMKDIEGVVLKQITRAETTDSKGKTTSSVTTMEVTALDETTVDDSMFRIPAGYTEKPLLPEGAEQPGDEEEQEAPAGLGGLLKAIGG